MKFLPAEPNEGLPISRMVSDNGQWEVGIWPTFFGFRVRLGEVGASWFVVDYCAGADPMLRAYLLAVVLAVCQELPDAPTAAQVHESFPLEQRKPIDGDGIWIPLVTRAIKREPALARIFGLPHVTCPHCHFTSYHPKDIEEGYCGHCHAFHSDLSQAHA